MGQKRDDRRDMDASRWKGSRHLAPVPSANTWPSTPHTRTYYGDGGTAAIDEGGVARGSRGWIRGRVG